MTVFRCLTVWRIFFAEIPEKVHKRYRLRLKVKRYTLYINVQIIYNKEVTVQHEVLTDSQKSIPEESVSETQSKSIMSTNGANEQNMGSSTQGYKILPREFKHKKHIDQTLA